MQVVLVEHGRGSIILRPQFSTSFYTDADVLTIAKIYWRNRCEVGGKYSYSNAKFSLTTLPNDGQPVRINDELFRWEASLRNHAYNAGGVQCSTSF